MKGRPEKVSAFRTVQFVAFANECLAILELVLNTHKMAHHIHVSTQKIEEALNQIEPLLGASKKPLKVKNAKDKHPALESYLMSEPIFMQMVYARFIDNFLSYLSGLLSEIYRAKPSALKSGQTLTTQEILQFKSMKKLVFFLAEKKVHELSYQGMDELNEYLSKQMKFNLFENEKSFKKAIEVVQIRNLITHNRGIVNTIFLERVPWSQYKNGEQLKFDLTIAIELFAFILSEATDIDKKAVAKFKIKSTVKVDLKKGPMVSGLFGKKKRAT